MVAAAPGAFDLPAAVNPAGAKPGARPPGRGSRHMQRGLEDGAARSGAAAYRACPRECPPSTRYSYNHCYIAGHYGRFIKQILSHTQARFESPPRSGSAVRTALVVSAPSPRRAIP